MVKIKNLRIKIFFDGARLEDLKTFSNSSFIEGFTTNPSLMKQAGVVDYEKFIKEATALIKKKPISFEVISDDFDEMKRQALKLSSFSKNIFVKIPITNTLGESSLPLIEELVRKEIKLNVTAVMTVEQIQALAKVFNKKTPVIVSIFAGRIADTGIDPTSIIRQARAILKPFANVKLLWASTRELLNIFQADQAGCDIITVVPEFLKKIHLIDYDLQKFSLDTVRMFFNDAASSGLKI